MSNSSLTRTISSTAFVQNGSVRRAKPITSLMQRISVSNFVFQLAIVFYCIYISIYLSELSYNNSINILSHVFQYGCLGFLIFKILLFNRYTVLELAVYLVLCVIAILSTINYGNALLYLVLFIIGAKDVNAHSICKTTLICISICSIIIILLSLLGILGNRAEYQVNAFTDEVVYRQAFGFTHFNNIGRLSLVAYACYLYMRYSKFSIFDVCITLIWAALLYFVITTKTAPILMIVATILVLLSKIMPFRGITAICIVIGCIGIIGSLFLAYYYDPSNAFMNQMNSWSSGRLRLAHYYFENYSITLFGQNINMVTNQYTLDNGYVGLLFRYGLFSLLAIIAAYIVAYIVASRKHLLSVIILITITLLLGYAEAWIYTTVGIIVLSIAFSEHISIPALYYADNNTNIREEHNYNTDKIYDIK